MAREERGATSHNSKDEWFEPVSTIVDAMDCPGGVCPVPWATKEEPPVIQEIPSTILLITLMAESNVSRQLSQP
jgi:hypothetical protein